MRRTATLLGLVLAVSALGAGSALARGAGGGRPHTRVSDAGGVPVDAQEPIEWLTDYDEACRRAAEKGRPILILLTTDELERTSRICNFAANNVRRAVRDAKVVPLKLRPPVMLETARLPAEEAKQREEANKKSRERYQALVKSLDVQNVPSLAYAAPDAAKLLTQSTPADQDIIAALARLPELVKAHQEALKAKGEARKPEPAAGGDAPKQPAETKPPPKKDPGTGTKPEGGDDF